MDKAHEAEQFLWHRRFLYSHGGFYSLVGRNFHRLRNHALFSIIFFLIRVCDKICKLVFIPEKVKKHIEAVRLDFFPCLMFLDHCLSCGQNFWMLQCANFINL